MTNEIKKILENHIHWLNGDCDGWENMKADLSCANLNGVNLRGVNLSYCDLSRVNLCSSDLSYANLKGAILKGANLNSADLRNVNLSGSDLSGVNLRGANLNGAYLSRADLDYADISGANLRNVDLIRASLKCANLTNTDLRGAVFICSDLSCADLSEAHFSDIHNRNFCFCDAGLRCARGIPFIPYACPETGSFIGYKKARNGIVELEIPADARRSSATGRKCRCDKAKVLGIYDNEHNLCSIKETVSNFKSSFVYRVGEIVEEPDFCTDRWDECAPGIHFFLSFQEAVVYG